MAYLLTNEFQSESFRCKLMCDQSCFSIDYSSAKIQKYSLTAIDRNQLLFSNFPIHTHIKLHIAK